MSTEYVTDEGVTLYRWEQGGERWACCAYDHGPMCRLCQRLDGIAADLLDNVEQGFLRVRATNDGDFKFQTTAAGEAHVAHLMKDSPEAFDIYMRVYLNEPPRG